MRIILGLAAGVAAMAIGTAVAARPGGASFGHGGSPAGVWSNGGGHHAGKGGRTRIGIGAAGIERRHGLGRGGFGRSGRDDSTTYYGGGIAGPVGEVGPHGNGFFTAGGGRIRLQGDRPHYEYDRAYPYEWASAARARQPDRAQDAPRTEARPRCTMENGVRVCRGW